MGRSLLCDCWSFRYLGLGSEFHSICFNFANTIGETIYDCILSESILSETVETPILDNMSIIEKEFCVLRENQLIKSVAVSKKEFFGYEFLFQPVAKMIVQFSPLSRYYRLDGLIETYKLLI